MRHRTLLLGAVALSSVIALALYSLHSNPEREAADQRSMTQRAIDDMVHGGWPSNGADCINNPADISHCGTMSYLQRIQAEAANHAKVDALVRDDYCREHAAFCAATASPATIGTPPEGMNAQQLQQFLDDYAKGM